ncbi:MAG: hypothetical protein JWP97_2348 [Labilithrix sp.]|nr:hypothetical protein [Labilithrix sp.]
MKQLRRAMAVAAIVASAAATSACAAPTDSAGAAAPDDESGSASDAGARELRLVVPSSITLPADGSAAHLAISVVRNGRRGPIGVKLLGLSPDLTRTMAASIPERSSEITAKLTSSRTCLSTSVKVRVETASGEVAEAVVGIEVGQVSPSFGNVVGCPGYVETSQLGRGTLVDVGGGRFLMLSSGCEVGRYWTADATNDKTFGRGGKVAVPGLTTCTSLEPLSDGRMLVVGTASGTGGPRFVRLSSEGLPDASFGQAGVLTIDPSVRWTRDRSDRIVVMASGPEPKGVAIVSRYDRDGRPDPTFATTELSTVDSAPTRPLGLAANEDGVFVAWTCRGLVYRDTGYGEDGSWVVLHRVLPGGGIDPSFGANGEMVLPPYASGPFAGASYHYDQVSWLRVLPSGALVMATEATNPDFQGTAGAFARLERPTQAQGAWTTRRLFGAPGVIKGVTEEKAGTFLVSSYSSTGYLLRIDAAGQLVVYAERGSADGGERGPNWVIVGDGTALIGAGSDSGTATIVRVWIQ